MWRFDADKYSFTIRETQTGEIIDDVANGKSEIGVIYLSEHNEEVISKLIRNNDLIFAELFVAGPHVYDAGCRNLQLDDCTWGAIVGDAAKQRYQKLGIELEDVKAQLLKVNNLALEGKPEDMVITSHICRGNYVCTFR